MPDGVRTGLDTKDESHQHPWCLAVNILPENAPPDISNRTKQKNVTRVSQQMLRYKLREL